MDDVFDEVMAYWQPDGRRIQALATRMDRATTGHTQGEALMALCFLLFNLLQDLKDPKEHAAMVSAVMRMIDPVARS